MLISPDPPGVKRILSLYSGRFERFWEDRAA
jgi:hypothetical protein